MGSPLPLPPARLAFSRPPPLACAPAATARPVSSPHRGCSLSFPLAAPRPRALRSRRRSRRLHLSASARESSEEPQPSRSFVQSLRVPEAWLAPPKALEESEWLRMALHKWLDDEFCPEEMNVEISRVAAQSYQESLLARNPDMGDILLKMATDLLSLSYQESFHGAFSAANAAVRLITERVESSSP